MTTNVNESGGGKLFFAALLAILFVLISAAAVWATQVRPAAQQVAVEPSPVAGAVEAVDLEAAINKGACIACHVIPNIPAAAGVLGPDLSNIGLDGATRIPGYTAEEYIRESIENSNAFIVAECPTGPCIAGTMPQKIQLDEAELEVIISYLSTLGVGD